MPIKEYVQLAREEIIDVDYNMVELIKLAWGREVHLDLDLNEEQMEGNDVDDQPIPIVKFPQACEYAQSLSNFQVKHSLEFFLL